MARDHSPNTENKVGIKMVLHSVLASLMQTIRQPLLKSADLLPVINTDQKD